MDIDSSAEMMLGKSASDKPRFMLTADDSGVFLTVYPNSGNPVSEPEILTALQDKNLVIHSRSLLIKALRETTGEPVKISTFNSSLKEPEIQVLVERDRLEAYVLISNEPNRRQVTSDEILDKLELAGVRYGINLESVKRACLQCGPKMHVASGLRPVDGQDARLVFHFDTENKAKPTENEDGSVDYKNINLFTTVCEGDVLAEKLPPVPGTAGIDVLGNAIQPKPGRDIPLPLGKNVVADGEKVIAAISGQAIFSNNKIHIAPVIVINGDVDFSSGNIEFTGNVTVRGSVQPGFSVIAGGDIEVQGTVCGGIVEGRNITIRMGIQGMFRGHVKASQNVYAKFIENSNVSADEDVYVSDVILHSRVRAKHKVIVEGRRGLIAGGQIAAGDEIRAKVAGTQLAITTDLEVGVNPALRDEYHTLRREIRNVESTLDQAQKSLATLRSVDQFSLSQEKRELLLKLTKAQFQLAGQAEEMRNRIATIEQELDQMRLGKIRIAEGVYPGVKIVVGTHVKPIREHLRFVTFHVDDGELKTSSYS